MSAAATAAGYLYASGRLRGRGQKEAHEGERSEGGDAPKDKDKRRVAHAPRRDARVAVYDQRADEPREPRQDAAPAGAPKRTPKIQYRTRRWKPDAPSE